MYSQAWIAVLPSPACGAPRAWVAEFPSWDRALRQWGTELLYLQGGLDVHLYLDELSCPRVPVRELPRPLQRPRSFTSGLPRSVPRALSPPDNLLWNFLAAISPA
eukprot:9396670-Alexandrium_andersonii.AAC.1